MSTTVHNRVHVTWGEGRERVRDFDMYMKCACQYSRKVRFITAKRCCTCVHIWCLGSSMYINRCMSMGGVGRRKGVTKISFVTHSLISKKYCYSIISMFLISNQQRERNMIVDVHKSVHVHGRGGEDEVCTENQCCHTFADFKKYCHSTISMFLISNEQRETNAILVIQTHAPLLHPPTSFNAHAQYFAYFEFRNYTLPPISYTSYIRAPIIRCTFSCTYI